jgi:hypothetical protein
LSRDYRKNFVCETIGAGHPGCPVLRRSSVCSVPYADARQGNIQYVPMSICCRGCGPPSGSGFVAAREDGYSFFVLSLVGTIPTTVRGVVYHTPIKMYLMPDFPRSAPQCFVNPTRSTLNGWVPTLWLLG